jgi:hypothetical protein
MGLPERAGERQQAQPEAEIGDKDARDVDEAHPPEQPAGLQAVRACPLGKDERGADEAKQHRERAGIDAVDERRPEDDRQSQARAGHPDHLVHAITRRTPCIDGFSLPPQQTSQ